MKTQFGLKPYKTFDYSSTCAVSNKTFYVANPNGDVHRVFSPTESEKIKFVNTAVTSFLAPASVKVQVDAIYPSPFHVVFSTTGLETFYLPLDSTTAVPVAKLHGSVVTCLAWVSEHKSSPDNCEFVCGCQNGKIYRVIFEGKKEKSLVLVADIASRVVDIKLSRDHSDTLFATTSTCVYRILSSPILVSECPVSSLNNKLSVDDDNIVYWANPVGIVALDKEYQVTTNATILNHAKTQLPLPEPIDFVSTQFSHIVLYEGGKLCLVSKICPGVFVATVSHSSALKGLLIDGDTFYAYSDQRVFEILCTNESSDSWIHYIRKNNFAKALESTEIKSQRAFILRAEADFILSHDSLDVCSELYGKALAEDPTSIDSVLDEIIVKLSPNKKSLLSFLMQKLDLIGTKSNEEDASVTVVQVNVLFMYCCELFIELILVERDSVIRDFLAFVKEKHSSLDIECMRTLNELLESVGLFDELVEVAEITGDLHTAIRVDLQRGNFVGIVDRLNTKMDLLKSSPNIMPFINDLSPILFRFCPSQYISFLIKSEWDPEFFLSSVMALSGSLTSRHKDEAIKYLFQWVFRKNSQNLLNALIVLVTEGKNEVELIHLLESVSSKSFFDSEFAMRHIRQNKLVKAEIFLLSLCGCYVEAVGKALSVDLALAKSCAWRSRNSNARRKCWLLIIRTIGTSVEKIMETFQESESVTIVDILPILASIGADNIDIVKGEVTELGKCLAQSRENHLKDVHDYEEALELIRKDLNDAPNTCLVLSHSQQCNICSELVFSQQFIAFSCSHCFHTECLNGAMAAKLTGVFNVDKAIESACCLCSEDSLLMNQIFEPFVDPSLDVDAINAWSIRS